jgi:signal transduction histidine kinase
LALAPIAAALILEFSTVPIFLGLALPAGLYAEVPAAYLFFLLLSLAATPLLFVSKRPFQTRILLALWLFLFGLLTYQFGDFAAIRVLLLLAFILQVGAFERFPVNLAICGAAILSGAGIQALALPAAGAERARALGDLVVQVAGLSIASAFVCLVAGYRERMMRTSVEAGKFKAIAENLSHMQLEYLEFAKSAEERSTLNERNRLSAELHDSVGYVLTNLEMMLEAAKDLLAIDPARIRLLLDTGLEQVRQGMHETRKTLYLLRDAEEPPPFFSAVQKLADVFRVSTGVEVQIDYSNFPQDCGGEVRTAFYHFIQEGLVNSFSHGRARRVTVGFRMDKEDLRVTIRDDGKGAASIGEGIGIRGMRERLGKLGGTLAMENLGDGFQIVASVPRSE